MAMGKEIQLGQELRTFSKSPMIQHRKSFDESRNTLHPSFTNRPTQEKQGRKKKTSQLDCGRNS